MTAYDDAVLSLGSLGRAIDALEEARKDAVTAYGLEKAARLQAQADLAACQGAHRPWAPTADRRRSLGFYREWKDGEATAVTSVLKAEAALQVGPARTVLRYPFPRDVAGSTRVSAQGVKAAGGGRKLILSFPLPLGTTLEMAARGEGLAPITAAAQAVLEVFGDAATGLVGARPLWEGGGYWYAWGYGIKGSTTEVLPSKVILHHDAQARIHDAWAKPFTAQGVALPAMLYNLIGEPGLVEKSLAAYPWDLASGLTVDVYHSWANRNLQRVAGFLTQTVDVAVAKGLLWGVDETSNVLDPRVPPPVPAGGDDPAWWPTIAAGADYAVTKGVLSHVTAFLADPPGQPRFDVLDGSFPRAKASLMATFD